MPRGVKRYFCRICGKHVDECGALSARGRCQRCGIERVAENLHGLAEHRGPAFQRWRRAMAASVGATLTETGDT